MDLNINKIDNFLSKMDARLQNLVENLRDKTDENLDKLEIMKNDVEIYDVEIQQFLQFFDVMRQQDQLDNNGDIEIKVKSLTKRFQTIQDDLVIMIKHTKLLLNVKMQLSQSCGNIEKRIFDIEREIENCVENPKKRQDLQNIGAQFSNQLTVLRRLDFDSQDLRGTLTSDSNQFCNLFEKLKQSQNIFRDLSQQYGNIIRSSIDTKLQSRPNSSTRSPAQSIETFSDKDVVSPERKTKSLVTEFLRLLDSSDRYLKWIEEVVESDILDIKDVPTANIINGPRIMHSFNELVQSSRHNIDLINGLDDEIKQMINLHQLEQVDGYNSEAAKGIYIRWKVTCRLAEDKDNDVMKWVPIHRNSTSNMLANIPHSIQRGSRETYSVIVNSRKGSNNDPAIMINSRKGSRDTCSSRSASKKGSKDYTALAITDRKWSSESHVSAHSQRDSEGSHQPINLEDWIPISVLRTKRSCDRTSILSWKKSSLLQVKSELEELGNYLKEFQQWTVKYRDRVQIGNKQNASCLRIKESWQNNSKQLEIWINNVQRMFLSSDEVRSEIKDISNHLVVMQREASTGSMLTDSFIDRFDQVKRRHKYWINQLIPISRRSSHHLKLDDSLANSVDSVINDLKLMDSAVHRLSLSIIEADAKGQSEADEKSLCPGPVMDDAHTTAPQLSSQSINTVDEINNDSSLMIPSLPSFEQLYTTPVSSHYSTLDSGYTRLNYHNNTSNQNVSHFSDNHQKSVQKVMSVPDDKSLQNNTKICWYHYLLRCFLASIIIICCILTVLSMIFMFQPNCENSCECSMSLSSFALKKQWARSAAI